MPHVKECSKSLEGFLEASCVRNVTIKHPHMYVTWSSPHGHFSSTNDSVLLTRLAQEVFNLEIPRSLFVACLRLPLSSSSSSSSLLPIPYHHFHSQPPPPAYGALIPIHTTSLPLRRAFLPKRWACPRPGMSYESESVLSQDVMLSGLLWQVRQAAETSPQVRQTDQQHSVRVDARAAM
jgi:hypothetical protein